jgi:MFS family permease
MPALIAARALQGLGAGGLMTLSQTTIADLVSPRERGRYQGYVAAVFALSSVAGPLLGGVITDMFSWPWIFYINVPVGALALFILAISLKPHVQRRAHKIDFFGFALLIGGTCTGLLTLSWGGTVYPWLSAPIAGLALLTFALFALLVPVERRATEPALPPRLFRNPVYARGAAGVTLATTAVFGSLVFIPLFFQLVLGASATEAGLRMAPMMGGLIISSVLGGRLVTRTGRYKRFLVGGLSFSACAFFGMSAAALLGASANLFDVLLVLLGLGMGLVLPNITTALQNAVDVADLGVATATQAFFRSLGGAFGVAMSGTILAGTLRLALPSGDGHEMANMGLDQVRALAPSAQVLLAGAYGEALCVMFAVAALFMLAALGVVAFMKELPLRGR